MATTEITIVDTNAADAVFRSKSILGSFAQELIDDIISHLHDGRPATLFSASLVCRRWHISTLPHIFRSISLATPSEGTTSNVVRVIEFNGRARSRAMDFDAMLLACPRIALCVQELNVFGFARRRASPLSSAPAVDSPEPLDQNAKDNVRGLLTSAIDKLVSLKSFILSSQTAFQAQNTFEFGSLARVLQLQSLSRVTLDHVTLFASDGLFLHTLSSGITHFTISNLKFVSEQTAQGLLHGHDHPCSIDQGGPQALVVKTGSALPQLATLLASTRCVPYLTRLNSLHVAMAYSLEHCTLALFQANRKSLEEIKYMATFTGTSIPSPGSTLENYMHRLANALDECGQLRRLHLQYVRQLNLNALWSTSMILKHLSASIGGTLKLIALTDIDRLSWSMLDDDICRLWGTSPPSVEVASQIYCPPKMKTIRSILCVGSLSAAELRVLLPKAHTSGNVLVKVVHTRS